MLAVLQEMVDEMDRIIQATERINEKLERELQDTVRILSGIKDTADTGKIRQDKT